MKKLFVTLFAFTTLSISTNAQDAPAASPQPPARKMMSAEEREAMKVKQEAELVEAFKRADLTDEQQIKARAVLDEARAKGRETNMNQELSMEDKQAKNKEINIKRDAQLMEIMGEPKFKAYQQIRKAQREANAPQAAMPMKN